METLRVLANIRSLLYADIRRGSLDRGHQTTTARCFNQYQWSFRGGTRGNAVPIVKNLPERMGTAFRNALERRSHCYQEAQLSLRNRLSAIHFSVAKLLSIAVMTYSYVYHLRNLDPANLLRTQRINFSVRQQHVRDPTVV